MLFWLFVIILVIGICLLVIGNINWDINKHHFMYMNDDGFCLVGNISIWISAIVLVTMVVELSWQYIFLDANIEEYKETYYAIEYKVSSGACRDELGFLSKEVIDEVQEWNENIKYYQAMQDNFWIGIFIPNIYDQFKTIDYESYNDSYGIRKE